MDIRDVSFKQYANNLRRTYWLKLIEQQAARTVDVAVEQASASTTYAQKH